MKQIAFGVFVAAALGGIAMPAAGGDVTGREVFDHYCTYCHGSSDGPGTMALKRARGEGQALLAERTDLTAEYIEYVVRHGLKAMPPFAPSDLTDTKLKAVAAYLAKSR